MCFHNICFWAQDFQAEEQKAKKASQKVFERLERQMNKAKLESDVRTTIVIASYALSDTDWFVKSLCVCACVYVRVPAGYE